MIMNTTKVEGEAMPNLRKAAILLVALGEGSSAELLQQLTEEEVQKVSREVAKLTAISAEQAEAVLEEFHHILRTGSGQAPAGPPHQSAGRRRRLLRRDSESRPAATGKVHPQ
jgi:flagellar motor switch protein FliG